MADRSFINRLVIGHAIDQHYIKHFVNQATEKDISEKDRNRLICIYKIFIHENM